MKEVWKDIPDYEGIYQASNLGRIRSLERYYPNGEKSFKHQSTTILKQHIKKHGKRKNVSVTLSKNNKHKTCYVCRLVASAFYGKSSLTVNHIDGNTLNNNVENLEWCSLEDNIKKGFETGRYNNKFTGIKIVDKATGTVYVFESCASAGRFFNKHPTYWFRKNKDTKALRWELL